MLSPAAVQARARAAYAASLAMQQMARRAGEGGTGAVPVVTGSLNIWDWGWGKQAEPVGRATWCRGGREG